MKRKIKSSQNGAISVFVMITMMFFLLTIIGVYLISSKRAQTQTESVKLVKDQYYTENEENDIYRSRIADSTAIIPIYTQEQLWSVGSGKAIEIEGKVYTFDASATYELKNDIVINIDKLENANNIDTSKINKNNREIYYYYNGDYYCFISGNLQNMSKKTLVSQITAANYGDKVNYSANGVDDWKIFYNDGNNVFLITSQCLNGTNAPLSTTGMKVNGTYGLYWENGENVNFQSGCKDYKDKFMAIGTSLNYQSGEEALACISTLLNYRNWEMFGNASSKGNNITGGIAIGSPTLEMWIESWNAKGYEPLRYTSWNDNKHVGVEFKDGDDNGMSGDLSLTATKGYDDSLFFPNYDYRLCTPQTNGETWATCGYGLFNPWVTEEAYGLRPVVMLQSNVKAVKGSDGKWVLEN